MSLIQKISGIFGGDSAAGGHGNAVLIVDGTGLFDGKKGEKLSPRQQIDILQSMSRVNKNEEIEVEVVFEGKPLRKVEHGGNFDDVTVFFSEDGSKVSDFIARQARNHGGSKPVTVVTGDTSLEEAIVKSGQTTLRPQTFRKAFGSGRGEQRGGSRPPRKRRRPEGKGEGKSNERRDRKSSPKPQEAKKSGDSVSDLIDLVD